MPSSEIRAESRPCAVLRSFELPDADTDNGSNSNNAQRTTGKQRVTFVAQLSLTDSDFRVDHVESFFFFFFPSDLGLSVFSLIRSDRPTLPYHEQ